MNPPAGWHPDPFDPSIDRYWDGGQWTGQTQPRGSGAPVPDYGAPTQVFGAPGSPTPDYGAPTQVFGAPGSPTPEPPAPSEDPSEKKRKFWPWIAGAAAVGIVGIGAVTGLGDAAESTAPVVTTTSSAAVTTTTTVKPTTSTTSVTTSTPSTTVVTTTPAAATTTVAIVPLVPQVEATTTTKYVPPPAYTPPAYTPPETTEPAYVPPPANVPPASPPSSGGTVHPGSYCSTLGATGVTTKGTAMVCGIGSDGKNRWKSAG